MQVKDVMTRDVLVIDPDNTLQNAADKMKDLDVGPLPVCEAGRLVGMLTDRDIVTRAVALGHDVFEDHVRDVMTPDVITCYEDQDIREAARIMQEKQVRRLLVLDRQEQLVGVISLKDLAVASGDEHLTAATLEQISQPGSSTPPVNTSAAAPGTTGPTALEEVLPEVKDLAQKVGGIENLSDLVETLKEGQE